MNSHQSFHQLRKGELTLYFVCGPFFSCWEGKMKCHLAKLASLMLKEAYTAFYCRNRTAMDESLTTADEIEQSKIEEIAGVPNEDKNMIVCPCKGIGLYCSSFCHPNENACLNQRNLQESETDSSETEVTSKM